jgi:hypothetical protein
MDCFASLAMTKNRPLIAELDPGPPSRNANP